jgi:hypothetical protein
MNKQEKLSYLMTRVDAAGALAMSLDHFERHVQPHLRIVRSGRLRLVPSGQLARWVEANAERA